MLLVVSDSSDVILSYEFKVRIEGLSIAPMLSRPRYPADSGVEEIRLL